VFDQAPAPEKVGVVGRQSPNRVQVIGQHTDRNRLEGVAPDYRRIGVAESVDMSHEQVGRAVAESHSEEEPTAVNPGSPVL
jgi:hypothetical protein